MIELRRARKYRLYPTAEQVSALLEWERQLRWIWNLAHEQRLMALDRSPKVRVDYYSQSREMTDITKVDERFAKVICSARQEVLRNLDKAWSRCFKKLGGRPRFKRYTDAVGIHFSTTKHWAHSVIGGALSFGGAGKALGSIRMKLDRPFGDAKLASCTIVRDVDQWFAVFPTVETRPEPTAPEGAPVGVNRGVVHAIADSNGVVTPAPEHFGNQLAKIARLARALDKKQPKSRNREKARVKLAKAHRKIRRQREWWQHQQSLHYASSHPVVAIEAFATRDMMEESPTHDLARRIGDVGWAEIARQITYKADATGAKVIVVPPQNISRTCSGCGAEGAYASGHAEWKCDACGVQLLGDVNAARNVLRSALNGASKAKKASVSIKIKGRKARDRRETHGGRPVEDPHVSESGEAGTRSREGTATDAGV